MINRGLKVLTITLLIVLYTVLVANSALAFNEEIEEEKNVDFIVCIDPGHQIKQDNKGESVAPNSAIKKARVSAGTKGIATKKWEYEVNLEAALILKEILVNKGYTVVMTREINDVNISNAERAEIANNEKADITIRLHCDSINDSSKTGAIILVPDKNDKYTKSIHEESNNFAEILKGNLKLEGVKIVGIFERKDITGFNWSKVPVIILEMGFMSNYNEDLMLSNPNYKLKLMNAVAKSVDDYKAIKDNLN